MARNLLLSLAYVLLALFTQVTLAKSHHIMGKIDSKSNLLRNLYNCLTGVVV